MKNDYMGMDTTIKGKASNSPSLVSAAGAGAAWRWLQKRKINLAKKQNEKV